MTQKLSITERLRDDNPKLWNEFQTLERTLCTPFGPALKLVTVNPDVTPEDRETISSKRLDELFDFFQILNSRKSAASNFWDRPAPSKDKKGERNAPRIIRIGELVA